MVRAFEFGRAVYERPPSPVAPLGTFMSLPLCHKKGLVINAFGLYALTLQRYLTRNLLHALFSVRQKGAVVALLDAGYQLENVRNRQSLQGQDHR